MNEENIQNKNQTTEVAQTSSGFRSFIICTLISLTILDVILLFVSGLGKIKIPPKFSILPIIFIFLIVPISWFFYKWSSEETRKKNEKMYGLFYKTIRISVIILIVFLIAVIINFNQSW